MLGRLIYAQCCFKLGNFSACQQTISQAKELVKNIPEKARISILRKLTAIGNKVQIESSGKQSVGNMNNAAMLPVVTKQVDT